MNLIITAEHSDWKAVPFFILTSGEYEHIMRGYETFSNICEVMDYLMEFPSGNTEYITTIDYDIVFRELVNRQDIYFNYDEDSERLETIKRNFMQVLIPTKEELSHRVKLIGEHYTLTNFILETYKPSTLPRLFYDFNMTPKSIDSNRKMLNHIINDGLKCGFSQDKLFEVIQPNQ